jgi:hypothetical protein
VTDTRRPPRPRATSRCSLPPGRASSALVGVARTAEAPVQHSTPYAALDGLQFAGGQTLTRSPMGGQWAPVAASPRRRRWGRGGKLGAAPAPHSTVPAAARAARSLSYLTESR